MAHGSSPSTTPRRIPHPILVLGPRIRNPPFPSPVPAHANRGHFKAGAASSSSHYPDNKSQKAFEKGLIEKTAKQTGDIILYDNRVVLYKMESDVMIYVVGSVDENEILLYNTVLALRDSLHLLFKSVHPARAPLALDRPC